MSENQKISVALPVDFEVIRRIIQDCSKHLASQGYSNWERYDEASINKLIYSGELFVLRDNEVAVGTVMISEYPPPFYNDYDKKMWEEPKAKAYYFTVLAVHPNYQGKGYSNTLLSFTEEYVRTSGGKYLRMTFFSANKSLESYYEKKGFSFKQSRLVPELNLTLSFGEKQVSF